MVGTRARAVDTETVLDRVVAPITYRIVFRPAPFAPGYVEGLADDLLGP